MRAVESLEARPRLRNNDDSVSNNNSNSWKRGNALEGALWDRPRRTWP